MALPLIWLGAGLAALYAGAKYTDSKSYRGAVAHMPGEGDVSVMPVDGCIVSCGVFGVFDHTGVWIDGNIIELKGNGLIRGISPQRFLGERSGDEIFVACCAQSIPLVAQDIYARTVNQLYQYSEYDLMRNNCHKFVWRCISGQNEAITRFTELNNKMAKHFGTHISWQKSLI
ncbi:MAG: hypothetical protein ACI88A_002308 [Paraglaciecola sp.]|jgi:hypothetical protein